MPLRKPLYRTLQQLCFAYWVSHSIFGVQADRQEVQAQKEAEKLVDWDYAGLHLINAIPIEDKLNYHNLCIMRRERQMYDPKRNISQSQEQYEVNEYRKLYNAVFSTKPPRLRTSEENYIQFLKDDFFRKQLEPSNPKTSRERYEWHVKKKQGSFFGGKYDFETYLAGNFTARRRRRSLDVAGQDGALSKRHRRRRSAGRRARKPEYPTPKVVDYLNERAVMEHNQEMAVKARKRYQWGSKENKPRAYYTSNESKKKPLYQYNERALLEKEVAKRIDYENYMADLDYRNKPKADYFKDEAKYRNIPKAKAEKMAREEGPKYKFKRIRRNAPTTKRPHAMNENRTTWAFANYRRFTGPFRLNFTAEIINQVNEGKEKMKYKQEALEATGVYPLQDQLENRTMYRLFTWRNFVDEVKTFKPYTFKGDPIDKELAHIDSIYIPSEEVTPAKDHKKWVMDQLVEYRKKYRGLTVREPFAHYPQYSWENIGFDINKLEDPLPPIWPLEKAYFNAEAMRAHLHVTEPNPVPHDDAEWDSMGREIKTVYVPPTKRLIIPVI